MNRLTYARVLYGALFFTAFVALAISDPAPLDRHLDAVGALTGISLCGQLMTHNIRTTVTIRLFDLDLGLALVAVALAGPVGALAVLAVPELIFLARRRERPWRLWAVANWVSFAMTALAGCWLLHCLTRLGAPSPVRLLITGLGMLVANYLFARLLLAVLRERANPIVLIRTELLRTMPLEMATITVGAVSALLIPDVGVAALAGFAALIYIPQFAASQLLRAPSVARLDVDAAAAIYRDALADELHFSGAERRYVHAIAALAERRPLPGAAPANALAAVKDALLVTICTERPPSQRDFCASLKVQAVLVARRWAQLTARCTPALSHQEAMAEMRRSPLARDAPLALVAADRIVTRERALSEHVAGVPRLHRTPLPRAIRRGLLPQALGRLAG